MSGYNRELVELLLPTVWDRSYAWGMVDERRPAGDMPRAPRGKTNDHNTLWAHLADIRRAWFNVPCLTVREAQALVLVGGLGMTQVEAGRQLGVSKQIVQRAFERGVASCAP